MKNLLPIRHKQHDFFIADIFDGIPYKDDMASMEHPFFGLSTKKDLNPVNYEHNGNTVNISPSVKGMPTIFDKDILLYCGSLLMAEVKKGILPPKTIRISSHDLLVSTNRYTNNHGYKLLAQALERIQGVSITTNIKTNNIEIREGFGLIDKWKIVESSRVKDRMVKLEITLSDWFYNSLLGNEVLTISPDYFRLRKPLERRLYELARKHCGNQRSWEVGIDKLHKKTGSKSLERKFRFLIKEIANNDLLPDYKVTFNSGKDQVTFINRGTVRENYNSIPPLQPDTYEKARKHADGIDIYQLESEWREWAKKNSSSPDNADGAFIGFVKSKTK
jgi:plasmid replication initiation protein